MTEGVRMSEQRAFKVYTSTQWDQRDPAGPLPWAPVDLHDGFVHLSTREQILETVHKHFAAESSLVLVEIHLSALAGADVRWEPSRGGALFPHIYGELDQAAMGRQWVLTAEHGQFRLPDELAGATEQTTPGSP